MSDFSVMRWHRNKRTRPRRCDDCGRIIPNDARYLRCVGVFEGTFGQCGYCERCVIRNQERYGWTVPGKVTTEVG